MGCYSFTLRVEGINVSKDRYEDALFEAGCDDALPVVVDGTLFLDFDREASDYNAAVRSAISSVEKAGGRVVSASSRSNQPNSE
jgi:hypothetical protein